MPHSSPRICEHGTAGPCLACAELELAGFPPPSKFTRRAEPDPPRPRAVDRELTAADWICYALATIVILIALFGLDGGMAR